MRACLQPITVSRPSIRSRQRWTTRWPPIAACSPTGVAPGDLVIAGDSAGGGLAAATALRLRELALPLPRALVLFSPWTDLTLEQLSSAPGEVMLNRPWLQDGARDYVAHGDARDPLVSPVFAAPQGLPPTLIQVGTDELLLATRGGYSAAFRSGGVVARLEEYPRRWHVFQLHAGMLADADRALDAVARFVAAAALTARR